MERRRKTILPIVSFSLLFGLISTLVYLWGNFGVITEEEFTLYGYILYLGSSVCAFLTSLYCFLCFRGSILKNPLGYVCLGYGLWLLAEVIWAYQVLALNIELPYPSYGELFWMLGYTSIIWGFLNFIKGFGILISPRDKSLSLIMLTLVFILVLFPLILSRGLYVSLLSLFFDVGYAVLSSIIFLLSLIILFYVLRGHEFSWLPISLGLILEVLGDIVFVWLDFYGLYYDGHLMELLWIFSYI